MHSTMYQKTFIARQPIFDRDGDIWGYEFLYRDSFEAEGAVISDHHAATMTVAANVLAGSARTLARDRLIVVNFTERSIMESVPYALPPERTVVEIAEQSRPSPDYLRDLEALKKDGYILAIDDYRGSLGSEPLRDLADIAVIDTLGRDRYELLMLASDLTRRGTTLLANRLEDKAAADMARGLGFALFQGFHFKRPEIMPGRTLPSNAASRLRLLRMAEEPEPDFAALTEAIQADVSIGYRLLRLLNSPGLGLPQQATSIRHAMLLLGWRQIRSWLRVALISDMSAGGRSSELAFFSAQRGKFFELVAGRIGLSGEEGERLFLLGLFSLLSPMLDLPMPDIIGDLPMDAEVKAALCGEQNRLTPWLILADRYESADWEGIEPLRRALGLASEVVAGCYFEAMRWANGLLEE